MKIRTIALMLTVVAGASLAAGQPAERVEVRLKATMHQALVDGDLQAAIEQYADIVARAGGNRTVAAQALLQMGHAYEKLGSPEALAAYERVLRDYADQGDIAAAARSRLAALEVEATQPSRALHTELLWEDAHPQGDISPDGRFVTYTDWWDIGNLAVRDLTTGESRRLTHPPDRGHVEESRISPDGEHVIYTWSPDSPNGELRLLPLHGERTQPRTVWSPAEGSAAHVQDWFPSGDRVVAVVSSRSSSTRHIVTVSTVDGQAQQVRSIDWGASSLLPVRVSPDGRYLAYSRSPAREAQDADIFLVAVDGSSETVIVQHAAHDIVVAWSQGGTHLLFNSDRTGQPGLWAQRVQDAEPVGDPELLVANLNVSAGMGVTRDGTLHYPVRVSRRRLKIAELDTKTGSLLRQPVNVTERFVSSNNVGMFSPDGEMLAYISERRGWQQQALVIQSLKTGEERDLPHELRYIRTGLTWHVDGDRVVVQGTDDRGRNGYFDVDVATGQTRPARGLPDIPGLQTPTSTPDGTKILFRKNGEQPTLYAYRVADGSVEALPGVIGGEGPKYRLSPDGQWIATIPYRFLGQRGPRTEIRLHPAVGGDGEVLATTDKSEPFGRWTTWTPDGTALLVSKREAGGVERRGQGRMGMRRLWVVPVDGSDPLATELVYEPSNAGYVPMGIHPDGKRIVYSEGGYFYQFWALRNLGLD